MAESPGICKLLLATAKHLTSGGGWGYSLLAPTSACSAEAVFFRLCGLLGLFLLLLASRLPAARGQGRSGGQSGAQNAAGNTFGCLLAVSFGTFWCLGA